MGGVNRNQRSKIRRSIVVQLPGPFSEKISKLECLVIKHARIVLHHYLQCNISFARVSVFTAIYNYDNDIRFARVLMSFKNLLRL